MTKQVREILENLFLTGRNAPPQDASVEIEAISAAQDLLDHLKTQPELQEPEYESWDTAIENNERLRIVAMLTRELGDDHDS